MHIAVCLNETVNIKNLKKQMSTAKFRERGEGEGGRGGGGRRGGRGGGGATFMILFPAGKSRPY